MSNFAQDLKQQADIVRIIGEYITLKKTGGQNFLGICPFHNEKTPSFSVHATRQFFHCFGCSESGDVFKFVQKIENITFPEAVRAVAQKLGVALPKQSFSSPEEAREAKQRVALIDIHEAACNFFQDQLRRPDAARAREYLQGRELSDTALRQFRIGFAPDSGFLLRDQLRVKFPEDLLKASGLFSWKEEARKEGAEAHPPAMYSKFRSRIVFPITNEQGKVIAFTGRTIETGERAGPKYLNSPETPIYSKGRVLFNLDKAKEAVRKLGYAILVEGNVDCISVFTAGFQNVIATSGTAFSEAQVRLLARFTKNVVVNFDPDTAGAAATERSLAMLVQEDFQIKVMTLEAGFDPDLFIRKKGGQAYAEALMHADGYFDYLIERTRGKFPVRTADGKARAAAYLLPYIKQVPNAIVRDELARNVAQKLGIDSALLANELRSAARRRGAPSGQSAQRELTDTERILIRALIGHASDEGSVDWSLSRFAKEALLDEELVEGWSADTLLSKLAIATDDLLADLSSLDLSDSERKQLLSALQFGDKEITRELIEESVNVLREKKIGRQLSQIQARLETAQKSNDHLELARLGQEKLELERHQRSLRH
jgi:DNA primase